MQPREQRSAQGKRQAAASEHAAAEHLHRRLMHGVVIVAHAGHEVAEQPPRHFVGLPAQGDDNLTDGLERGAAPWAIFSRYSTDSRSSFSGSRQMKRPM